MINNQLLVTIAIPFYNGFNQINHILTELYTPNIHNYEILIIDDNSIESESIGLKDLIKLKYSNGNLRYILNEINLGMDLNFEKCIKESLGIYTWFFGQDDYLSKENLTYCINQINSNKPDVIFANYTVNRTWNYNSTYIFNKNLRNSCSIGANHFLKINNGKVPSFLPSLIIKTENWPNKNIITKFYGTHFIQLAIFIYNVGVNKKWLYIGKPLAIGVIPSTGWQNALTNRIKYYKGFIECLDNLQQLNIIGVNQIVKQQKNKSFLQHMLLTIECKIDNNQLLLNILSNETIFPKRNRIISIIINNFPIILIKYIQSTRKLYYKLRN